MALPGCSSLELPKDMRWPWEKDKTKVPVRMTDLWTFTVLRQTGQPGVRGFGGRVIFFNADDKAIKVDGTITVYAFDARSDDPGRAQAERKFVFLPDDLPKHHEETKLGHSYNFWLPWDEVGSKEMQISLVTRYEGKDGDLLMGSPCRQILSGAKKSENNDAKKPPRPNLAANAGHGTKDDVKPVSYEEEIEDSDLVKSQKSTTTTISLSPNFVRQSLQAPQDEPAGNTESKTPAANNTIDSNAAKTSAGGDAKASTPQANSSPASSESAEEAESSTRFVRRRFRAQKEASAEPRFDPIRRQPYPGQWPSALPATPRSGRWAEIQNSSANAAKEPSTDPTSRAVNTQN